MATQRTGFNHHKRWTLEDMKTAWALWHDPKVTRYAQVEYARNIGRDIMAVENRISRLRMEAPELGLLAHQLRYVKGIAEPEPTVPAVAENEPTIEEVHSSEGGVTFNQQINLVLPPEVQELFLEQAADIAELKSMVIAQGKAIDDLKTILVAATKVASK